MNKKSLSVFIGIAVLLNLSACQSNQIVGEYKPTESQVIDKSNINSLANSMENEVPAQSTLQDKNKKEKQPSTQKISVTEVVPEVDSDMYDFCGGSKLGLFVYSSKWGFIDESGKVVIEPVYEHLTNFSEGYAFAQKGDTDKKMSFIVDEKGNEIPVDASLDLEINGLYGGNIVNPENFHEGIAVIQNNATSSFVAIDIKGTLLFELPDRTTGFLGVFNDGAMAMLRSPSNGVYEVAVINNKGQLIASYSCPNNIISNFESASNCTFSDGLFVCANSDGMWGAIDNTGKTVIEFTYEKLTRGGDGLIGYLKYGKWGYMDYKGNVVIEPEFEEAERFSNGLAAVQKDGGWGYIDKQGSIVVTPSFEVAGDFYDTGLAVVQDTSKRSVIDIQGNIVISNETGYGIDYYGGNMVYLSHDKLYKILM